MNKPRRPVIVILVTLGCAALILLETALDFKCIFRQTFGIPCLTCGMTRAVLSAIKLDFRAAFRHHPLFWTLPILYWTVVTELSPFKNRRANKITVTALLSAFIAVWVVRLTVGLT